MFISEKIKSYNLSFIRWLYRFKSCSFICLIFLIFIAIFIFYNFSWIIIVCIIRFCCSNSMIMIYGIDNSWVICLVIQKCLNWWCSGRCMILNWRFSRLFIVNNLRIRRRIIPNLLHLSQFRFCLETRRWSMQNTTRANNMSSKW